MKKLTRLFFGLVTSLLLSAGFVHAAERTANNLTVTAVSQEADLTAPFCVYPCAWL